MTIAPERETTFSEPPGTSEALIREARRRQRRRYSIVIAAILLVGSVGVLAWGGSGTNGSGSHGGAKAGGDRIVIPSKSQLNAEMLAFYFPTSAADFTKGFQFNSLTVALMAQHEAACLTQAGFPSSIRLLPLGDGLGDNTEFPDTTRISARGLNAGSQGIGGAALVSRRAQATGHKAQLLLDAKARCRGLANTLFAPLHSGNAGALYEGWMSGVVPQIDESTAFKTALVGWSTCMQSGGVNVATMDEFFGYADRSQMTGPAPGTMLRIGRLFGRCIAPAESVRVHLRLSARSTYLAEHSAEVANLSALVRQLVR